MRAVEAAHRRRRRPPRGPWILLPTELRIKLPRFGKQAHLRVHGALVRDQFGHALGPAQIHKWIFHLLGLLQLVA